MSFELSQGSVFEVLEFKDKSLFHDELMKGHLVRENKLKLITKLLIAKETKKNFGLEPVWHNPKVSLEAHVKSRLKRMLIKGRKTAKISDSGLSEKRQCLDTSVSDSAMDVSGECFVTILKQ